MLYGLSFISLLVNFKIICGTRERVTIYTDNGYEQTAPYYLNRPNAKDDLEDDLLAVFGLDHVPRPTRPGAAAPDEAAFMIRLYQSMTQDDDDEESLAINPLYSHLGHSADIRSSHNLFDHSQADLITSFVNKDNTLDQYLRQSLQKLRFDLSDVDPEDELIGAELRLFQNGTLVQQLPPDGLVLKVQLVRKSKTEPVLEEIGRLSLMRQDTAGWRVVNATKALLLWLGDEGDNLGLRLEIENEFGHIKDPSHYGFSRSFLVGLFRSAPHQLRLAKRLEGRSRRKRSPMDEVKMPDDDNEMNLFLEHGYLYYRRSCQRRQLYVNFQKLNWGQWIIAPTGYHAFFCSGGCSFPINPFMNATNHAIVQALVHVMDHRVPQPSCAPTRLSALRVLYIDDTDNVVLKRFPKMVIKSCGCH